MLYWGFDITSLVHRLAFIIAVVKPDYDGFVFNEFKNIQS